MSLAAILGTSIAISYFSFLVVWKPYDDNGKRLGPDGAVQHQIDDIITQAVKNAQADGRERDSLHGMRR